MERGALEEGSGGGGAADWTVFKVAPVFRGGAGMLCKAGETKQLKIITSEGLEPRGVGI